MRVVIRNGAGERLDTSWHAAAAAADAAAGPVLVLGHGVTANKDRAFLLTLAEAASGAGIDALRMSFAGNGASQGRFEDCTVSKEIADLRAVLDALGERPAIYAGHSMGAAVGVLAASRDERIRYLVSLAGMVHTQRFVERKFAGLVPGRDAMWDKPECPLSQTFLDDMRAIGSVAEHARGLELPWLFVHGTADTVVPLEESQELAQGAGAARTLRVLEGADHVFSDGADRVMAGEVVSWLRARGLGTQRGSTPEGRRTR